MTSRRPCMVVGYDGSKASRAAVAVAARRAGPDGIVHVVHTYEPAGRADGLEDHETLRAASRTRAQALLDAILLTGDDELLDTEYDALLVEGPAAHAIAAAAVATIRRLSTSGARAARKR